MYPIIAKFVFAESINNASVLFLRFGGCILFLWGYVAITRRSWRLPLNRIVKLVVLGGVVYGLMSALNLHAISRISASLASLILCAYPVFVALVLIVFRREQPTRRKLLSLAVCFLGLFLLLDVTVGPLDIGGIVCALGASLSYTAYVILGGALNKGLDPVVCGAYIMTGAVITYTVSGLASGNLQLTISARGWILMALMAVVSTALPVMLFWMSVEKIGVVKASIIGSVEPLSTVLLALGIFQERLTIFQAIGAVLIILGVVVIQLPVEVGPPFAAKRSNDRN